MTRGRPKKEKVVLKKLREDSPKESCFAWKGVTNKSKKSKNYGKIIMQCICLEPRYKCLPEYCAFYKTIEQDKQDREKARQRLLTLPARDQFIINETYYKRREETI
jgi:hypothetical protein